MASSKLSLFLASFGLSLIALRVFQSSSFAVVAVTTCLTSSIFWLLWQTILWPFYFSPLRSLPGPKCGSLLMGQKKSVPDERSGVPMDKWVNEIPHDGLLLYRMSFNKERLLIADVKALAEVLVQRSYDFAKPFRLRLGLGRILGVGLIVAEGAEHKEQRKKLTPAFTHRHIQNLAPVFWNKAIELSGALYETLGSNGKQQLNITEWLNRTTLDVIGVAGMGHDFKAIRRPDNEISKAYTDVFVQAPKQNRLLTLIHGLAGGSIPFLGPDSIGLAVKRLRKIANELIKKKREAKANSDKSANRDIISVAMSSEIFTDDELANQILTFLAAGHETTATSMTWALLSLAQHPEIQEKLRVEIHSTLPSPHDTETVPENMGDLMYLQAVINESLRLHPPAGITKRVATIDTTILGQVVPRGTEIVIGIRAINRSISLWGADAGEFVPERWLEPDESTPSGYRANNSGGASSNYCNLTFLHGPRSCIGQAFARSEFAYLLAVLIGRFRFVLPVGTSLIELETGLTTRPKGGLEVMMTPIDGW